MSRDVCSGMAASSYSAHFLEGVAIRPQASDTLTLLLHSVKSASRDDTEAQIQLALSSVEDMRSFLGHDQIAQFDCLGALMAGDVNLMLACRDRFLSHLRL